MRSLAKAFDVSYSAMRSFLEREGVKTPQGKKTLELVETDKNAILWSKILGMDRLIAELDKVCVNRYRINGSYHIEKRIKK